MNGRRRVETHTFNPNLCIIALLSIAFSACTSGTKQITEERACARFLARIIAFSDSKPKTNAMTNLQEIFEITHTPYPKHWHYRFQRFGRNAGFQNSLYEKYVLVSGGLITNGGSSQVVLMNAKPFLNEEGENGRLLLLRTQSDWQIEWFSERRLQALFNEAGQTIPPPPVLPPPADLPRYEEPPFFLRVQDFFGDVTANLGLGTGSGKYLMYATFGLLAIGAALVVWLGLRKRE